MILKQIEVVIEENAGRPNENSLIEQLRNKDPLAFKTIVETWQDMVYNTALGIVQNAEDAEDLAQDVFIQVYKSIRSFKGECKLSSWLYRITVTKAIDHERKKKRKKRFAQITPLSGEESDHLIPVVDFYHPGIMAEKQEIAAALFRSIRELQENQRIAYTLHNIERLSYKEISDIMNMSLGAVESLIFRAKANLRKSLELYYKHH